MSGSELHSDKQDEHDNYDYFYQINLKVKKKLIILCLVSPHREVCSMKLQQLFEFINA